MQKIYQCIGTMYGPYLDSDSNRDIYKAMGNLNPGWIFDNQLRNS